MTRASSGRPQLAITGSRHLTGWMADQRLSLGFSTYQAGKLFMVGLQGDGRLSIYERTFNRAMGLYASEDAQTLWMASLYQLWRFENYVPRGGATADGYDRLYVPTLGHTTGDIDIHDVHAMRAMDAMDGAPAGGAGHAEHGMGAMVGAPSEAPTHATHAMHGAPSAAATHATHGAHGGVGEAAQRPVFVATLFNCLGTVSHTHSFQPLWKPPFISALVPEDRCHLNGLAMESGRPAYVTMVSRSDVADGWRDRRIGGGIVMEVRANEAVCEGLSMPHSPRVHPDYPGRIWLLQAGTGFLGYVDLSSGEFVEVAFCPGFVRGLAFIGRYAIVGISATREDRTFGGLPLEDNLKSRDADPRCALHIVNLDTGATEYWLRIEGVVRELYDVVALRGVQRPMLLGFKTDEIHRTIRLPE